MLVLTTLALCVIIWVWTQGRTRFLALLACIILAHWVSPLIMLLIALISKFIYNLIKKKSNLA